MTHTSAATAAVSTARLDGLEVRHRALDDRVCVVTLEGEVDLASAPALKSALAKLVGQGYREFVFDLSQVGHMDSTGLGVLIGLQRRLVDDGNLVLAGAPRNVMVLFELTGLDGRFDTFSTVEESVGHLGATSAGPARPALSTDAAMVVGLAATALPFADSSVAEAERWLRILRRHGDAARALSAAGVTEAAVVPAEDDAVTGEPADLARRSDRDVIASIVEQATRGAEDRGAKAVGTGDVLLGVMYVYGSDFDRVLRAHGSERTAVTDRLGLPMSRPSRG